MSGTDINQIIDAYLDGTLTKAQGERLNRWVNASPENARAFAKASWLHRQVYDSLHVRDLQELTAGAGDTEPESVLAQLRALEEGAGEGQLVNLTDEVARREAVRRRAARRAQAARQQAFGGSPAAQVMIIPRVAIYAIAAMILFGLLTAVYAGLMSQDKPTQQTAQRPAPRMGAGLPPVVAELIGGNQPVFRDASLSNRVGAPMRQGLLELVSGTARVQFHGGATATFRAPAVIDLRGENRMALIQGAMVADVPEHAYGFTVDTPSMRIIDLGTEFGLTTDAQGSSAVQVFVGEVNAAPYDASGQLGVTTSVRSRRGLAVDGTTFRSETIQADGRAFEDIAPHVALLYRNLVVNGDFEEGQPGRVTGDTFPEVVNVAIPGWEDSGPATVIAYQQAAAFGYPDPARHVLPTDRGNAYYAGMAEGTTYQRIGVADLSSLIDAGQVRYDLSAWLGGFAEQDEHLRLSIRFLDARGRAIGQPALLDPVHVYHRRSESGFLLRERAGDVPAGTRSIRIEIENIGIHTPPYVRDGYADNIALELSVD